MDWVAWGPPENGFDVYWDDVVIASVAAGVNTYTDTGLTHSTTYVYKIRAFNDAGEVFSNIESITTLAIPLPGKTTVTVTDATKTTIDLSWIDIDDLESGYRILRDGNVVGTVGADIVSFTDTGLIAGTTYVYVI